MLRSCGGLTICMDDPIYGRAEYVFFSSAITKSMFQSQVVKWYPLFSTAVNNHAVDNYRKR
jgi:hypothetical protein